MTPFPGAPDADCLALSTTSGLLAPGAEARVQITFCPKKKEVRLKSTRSLTLTLTDGRTGDTIHTMAVNVTGSAVYSKVSFLPQKGVNFGALRYGSDRERRVEIRNSGAFPFDYKIVPVGSPEDIALNEAALAKVAIAMGLAPPAPAPPVVAAAPAPTGKGGKGHAAAAGASPEAKGKPPAASPAASSAAAAKQPKGAPPPGSVAAAELAAKTSDGPVSEFGRFHIDPLTGTVPPGGSAIVAVRFFPAGARVHRVAMRVHISGMDWTVAETADALSYELVGESCVPGIDSQVGSRLCASAVCSAPTHFSPYSAGRWRCLRGANRGLNSRARRRHAPR